MKAIRLIVEGIRCDNPNCDYKIDAIRFEDYMDWLNKPCPQCGQNLLTEKDLDTIKKLAKGIDLTNWLLSPFMKTRNKVVSVPIEMNGTGKLTFKEIDDGKRIYEKEV